MAWVPCGISLQYSHVQQLNNCKQPDLESVCPKLSNGICLQNSPLGGRVSLAGPRTNCYEPSFVSVSVLNHVICENWPGVISKEK